MSVVKRKLTTRLLNYLTRIKYQFFTKKVTFIKWQLNIFTILVLLLGGAIVTFAGVLPKLLALNETTFTIQNGGDSNFTLGTTTNVTATASNITLAKDTNWFSLNWNYKKQLTIKNTSSATLNANSSMTISVDTSSLESVLANCNDIRIIYQNTTELPLTIKRELGSTNCNDSKVTNLTFPIQANLTTGSTDSTNYALYYGNASATSQGTNGYSIPSGPVATMVCSFNGTSTCETGQTPSTESGAIRYSTKSALSFDGTNDVISFSNINSLNQYTIEGWFYLSKLPSGFETLIGFYSGSFDNNIALTVKNSSVYCAIGNVNDSSRYTGTSISTGSWTHLACGYDGSNLKIYKNGVDSGTRNLTGLNPVLAGVIGANSSYGYFSGITDEIRVSDNVRYSGAFTPQISPFITDSNTKLLYHFDENGDDPRNTGKAIDASGNGNHGTILGAKYVGGIIGVDSSANDSGKLSNQSYASHSGVMIEEGTTNLITNPSFENASYNTNWSKPYTNYSDTTPTFTPNIAKRTTSAGPFATGAMVQGKATGNTGSDIIASSTGTQIATNFYPQLDGNQGSIVFWVTPEWNGNDGLIHRFLIDDAGGGNGHIAIQKDYNNFLIFYYFDGTSTWRSATTSATAWTASTTYLLIARWDTKNTLDGTNHLSITINGATTFGGANLSGASTPSSNLYIGGDSNGGNPANALIQGLTIYRRPLYEATTPSGINVGNGDELSQIYNGGSGKDPTQITGSWDIVYALPMVPTAGSLTTSTNEAWSHPHSAEIIKDAFAETTYSTSAWSTVGVPLTGPTDMSTSEKIYNWGYKWSSANTNEGISQTQKINYISNGTFDLNTNNWIPNDANTVITSVSGGVNGNCLQLSRNSIVYSNASAYQMVQLIPLRQYRIEGYIHSYSQIYVGTTNGANDLVNLYENSTPNIWLQKGGVFTSPANGIVYITLGPTWVNSASTNIAFDNIFLRDANNYQEVIRPVINYDSTARPIIKVLDATNGDSLITSITAPDLTENQISNGNFTTDTTGWSGGLSATLSSITGGQSGNAIQVQNGAASFGYAMQTLQLSPNSQYSFSVYMKNGTGSGMQVYINADTVGGTLLATTGGYVPSTWTQYSFTFLTSTTGLVVIRLNLNQNTNGLTGLFDEIVLQRVISRSHPWTETFTFTIPTIAFGAVNNCETIKIQILNTTSTGTIYLHQIEVLANLIYNTTFEYGTGNPYVPTGWSNDYAAGETSKENLIVHSGSSSLKISRAGSTTARVSKIHSHNITDYFAYGIWMKNTSGTQSMWDYYSRSKQQAGSQNSVNFSANSAAWKQYLNVYRGTSDISNGDYLSASINAGTGYFADFYKILLTPVTLSVTPASLANSTESSGVRVDGKDTLTQTVSNLSATSGIIKFKYTPRHNAADMLKFGITTPYIIDLYGDATNYIRAYWSAANTVAFTFNDGGVPRIKYWDATGAIVAGTTYNIEISYASTQVLFKVDGVNKVDFTKVTNWWTAGGATGAVAAYAPQGSASLAASYSNLVTPATNDAALGVAPTWDSANGWIFNGTTQYLRTGIIPSSTTSAFIRYSAATANDVLVFGENGSTSSSFKINVRAFNSVHQNSWGNARNDTNSYASYGNVGMASNQPYFNGILNGGVVSSSWSGTPVEFYIGAINTAGSPTFAGSSNIQSAVFYSTTLTANQVSAVTGAMGMITSPSFTTIPTTAYFGSKQDGTMQSDATFNNFTTLTPTLNTTAPYMKFGSNSAKLVNGGNTGDEYTTTINVGNITTNTLSAYVYDGTAGNVGGIVGNTIAELYYNTSTISTTYTDMGGGWWRLTGTLTGVNANALYGVQVKSGKTIYVDGVQLENKGYATTYADGSLGSGYSWSGNANYSPSTRTGGLNTALTYSPTSNISSTQGSISFWLKRQYIATDDKGWGITAGYVTTHSSGDGSTNQINVYSNGSTLRCYGWWGASDTVTTVGQWYNVIVTWDSVANSRKCYVNNVQKGSTTGGSLSIQTLKIGQSSQWGLSFSSDGIISDFRIFNQALSSTQVSDIYNQGIGLHSQGLLDQKKYSTTGTWESPVINLNSNASWGISPNFVTNETLNGNIVSYDFRTSADANIWTGYTANSGTNPNYTINALAQKYVQVKATLNSTNQSTTPTVSSMSIHYVEDTTAPITNALNTTMKSNSTGRDITETTGWTNDLSPYFRWDLGVDNIGGSGIKGYCLSLSQTLSDNPAIQKGLLGTSPLSNLGSNCQFIVGTNEIDFSDVALRGNTWLSSSNNLYYLNIKAIDNTGNTYPDSETFEFLYDDIPPTNVTSFSAPQNSFANVDDIYFNWPVSGNGIASDSNSQLLGYQYSLNNETDWTGSDTSSILGLDYIPLNHTQPFFLTVAHDSTHIQMGNNTIYFKAVDIAGNRSTISRSALISYGGDAPKFADGSSITITPEVSVSNMYSVSWPSATPSVGRAFKSYYYMINTTPPNILSTILSNSNIYIPTTTNSISEGKLVGAVKGQNTIYVVATDDLNNYSAGNALSKTFTLNSTLPDPALNLRAADTSIKSVSLWSVSLAWEEPSYKGTGALTYEVSRSEDNINWTKVSETNGTAFVDTLPTSKKYYYRIGSMDSTNDSKNSPSYSLSVSILPKGSYTVPAPLVSNPVTSSITTRRATVSWVTSRGSDSRISYGNESGKYFEAETSISTQTISHVIPLTNLLPSTTYYYKALWTDEDGNKGESNEQTFVTNPAPVVKDVNVRFVNTSSAQLQFTTKDASKVKIYYGKTTQFGGMQELPTSINESKYTVILDGLDDGTKYYYRVNPYDIESTEYEGTVLDLTTLPKPKVSEVKLQQIKNTAETSIIVSWKSNTEISSVLSYYPESNSALVQNQVNLSLLSGEHKMTLQLLKPDTPYILFVKGSDRVGNEAISNSIKFTTASDTRSPVISEMTIETVPAGTSGSSTDKSQIVVSWNTDELATSSLEYGEGYSEIYQFKSSTDYNLTYNHVVAISGLSASKVYHLRAVSKDKADNIGYSSNSVVITAKASGDATNLILDSLKNLFNF